MLNIASKNMVDDVDVLGDTWDTLGHVDSYGFFGVKLVGNSAYQI